MRPHTHRQAPLAVTWFLASAELAASVAGAQTATTPAWTAGGPDNAIFGWTLARAGDVNGDGYDDLVVGEPYFVLGAGGRVRTFRGTASGPSSEATWSADVNWSSHLQALHVAGVGDVNDDGYDDFAVGGAGYTGYTACAVYAGSANGPTHLITIFEGIVGDGFGSCVAGADVDGDGYSDLVVGEPYHVGNGAVQGRVLVYRGGPSGPSSAWTWNLNDANALDRFGSSVAGVGDVDGDGYDDLVVGSTGLVDYGGRAQLFRGSPSGPQTTIWHFSVPASGLGMRNTIAGAGDVDGDGRDDVLVGAPHESGIGRVRLFLGATTGLAEFPVSVRDGPVFDSQLGIAVCATGDVNGDGHADALIGASGPFNGAGSARLYLGSPTGLAATPAWEAAGTTLGDRFGEAVAALDCDGNGFPDMVAGAPWADGGRGRAALFASAGGSRIGEMDLEIAAIDDPFAVLQGLFAPGSLGGGFFAFETRAGDAVPGTTIARYPLDAAPYLLDLRFGIHSVRSDPLFPDVRLELEDHPPGQGTDRFTLLSLANRPLFGSVGVDSIALQLVDPSGTALQSEHQVQRIPILGDWPQRSVRVSGALQGQPLIRFDLSTTIAQMRPVLGPVPTGPVIGLPRCFIFQAQVTSVVDPTLVLQGAVAPQQGLTGQYVYNARTNDSNALPSLGEFAHTANGFGIEIDAGGLVFRTDPLAAQFLVRVGNGVVQGGQPLDLFELRSTVNLPPTADLVLDNVSWTLTDPTATALASDALPDGPPVLAGFSGNALYVAGRRLSTGAFFDFVAEVHSCVPCTEARSATSDAGGAASPPLHAVVGPNPFRATTFFRVDPVPVGAMRIDIWDVAGRHVRRIVSPAGAAARGATVWDGADDRGRPIAAGVYVYRVRTSMGVARGTLVHLR